MYPNFKYYFTAFLQHYLRISWDLLNLLIDLLTSVITPEQQNKEVSEHSYSCNLNSALYSICPNLTPSGQGGCLWSLPLFCVSSRPPFKFPSAKP